MKQPEDTKTIDMFDPCPLPDTYTFWVETRSGEYIEWAGLTRKTAVMFNNMTQHNTSDSLKRFGWHVDII